MTSSIFALVSLVILGKFLLSVNVSPIYLLLPNIVGFIQKIFSLVSLVLMITNSVLLYASNCKNTQGHFYSMVSTMLIVMWVLMGGHFFCSAITGAIARCIDESIADKKEERYEVLMNKEIQD